MLVVGTGAGGIQSLLAGWGLESVGLDLATAVPLEHISRVRYGVPDLPACRLCTISPVVLSTDGDWFGDAGEEFLRTHSGRTLVVDVEAGDERFGLELLRPALDGRFSGTCFLKVLASRNEAEGLVSALAGGEGTRRVAWTSFSRFGVDDPDLVVPGVVRVELNGQARMGSDRREVVIIPARSRLVLAADPARRRDRVRQAVKMLSGGSLSASSLENLVARAAAVLDGYKDGEKGSTAGALGLSVARVYACVAHLTRMPERPTMLELAEHLLLPIEPMVDGKIRVSNDKTTRYMMQKLMPRVLSALATRDWDEEA